MMNKWIPIPVIAILAIGVIFTGLFYSGANEQLSALEKSVSTLKTKVAESEARVSTLQTDLETVRDSRSATLVVAASNSKFRKHADFVSDGINDDEEIMAAVSALPGGGDIYLAEGTYIVRVNQINLDKPNIRFRGSKGAVIKLADSQSAGHVIMVTASNSVIEGITIDGNFAGQQLPWNNYYGINIRDGVTDTLVKDCVIRNVGNDAIISAGGNHRTRVVNNLIYDCGEGILWQYSDFWQVIGNTLYNIGTGSMTTQDAIEPAESNHSVIANNLIYNIHGNAIDVYIGCDYSTITGNNIYAYGQIKTGLDAIIAVTSSNYVNISGNTIRSGYGAGIRLTSASSYSTITSNVIEGCSGDNGQGVRIERGSIKNVVSSNNILNCNESIMVVSGDCLIIGNQTYYGGRPLDISGGYNTVTGNRVFSPAVDETAILVENNYNIITNNYIDGDGKNSYGIRSTGDYDHIANNLIRNFPDPVKRLVISGANTKAYEN